MKHDTHDGIVAIVDSAGKIVGSGFIAHPDGLIVTCRHVVRSRDQCWVRLCGDSTPYRAISVTANERTDLAVLRIDRTDLPAVEMSSRWDIGMPVSSYGFPVGYREEEFPCGVPIPEARVAEMVTVRTSAGDVDGLLLAKAEVDNRLSGAPALDAAGDVIGVLSWRIRQLLPDGLLDSQAELARYLKGSHAIAVPTRELLTCWPELPEALPPVLRKAYNKLPAQTPPSALLRPEYQVVPFIGRIGELRALHEWCTSETSVNVKLIHGPGGVGKTRLAAEFAKELRESARGGWVAGFLGDKGTSRATDMDTIGRCSRRVLVIIDYAETRIAQIHDLLNMLASNQPSSQVFVLMLARNGGDWWDFDVRERHAEVIGEEATKALRLQPLHDDIEGKRASFRAAVDGFARYVPDHVEHPVEPDLNDPAFASVLATHIAAYLALRPSPDTAVGTASEFHRRLRKMLVHETSYWEQSAKAVLGAGWRRDILEQAVTAATVCGAEDHQSAVQLLRRVPVLRDQSQKELHGLAAWLHGLYPGDEGYLAPLQPDRLGEDLVAFVISRNKDLPARVLEGAEERRYSRALAVIDRAVANYPGLDTVFEPLFAADPHKFIRVVARLVTQGSASAPLRRFFNEKALFVLGTRDDRVRRLRDLLRTRGVRTILVLVAVVLSFLAGYRIGQARTPAAGSIAGAESPGPTVVSSSPVTGSTEPGATPSASPTDEAVLVEERFDHQADDIENGQLVVRKSSGKSEYSYNAVPIDGDVRVQVSFRLAAAGRVTVGVFCGRQHPTGDKAVQYQGTVDNTRRWTFVRLDYLIGSADPFKTERTELDRGTLPVALSRQGSIALDIVRSPRDPRSVRLRLLLNNKEIATTDDRPSSAASFDEVGFFVKDAAVDVRFDDLVATRL